jgi:hypothetical protein
MPSPFESSSNIKWFSVIGAEMWVTFGIEDWGGGRPNKAKAAEPTRFSCAIFNDASILIRHHYGEGRLAGVVFSGHRKSPPKQKRACEGEERAGNGKDLKTVLTALSTPL